jgi:hypothetical protein
MTGQTDSERYKQLIERLLVLHRRESELDPLTASFEALTAVLGFLYPDIRLFEAGATRVLARLQLALLDRLTGSKPKLFFDPVDRKGAKGAPSYTSAVILRALVNMAFLSLLGAGMAEKQASNWLASKLKDAGIKQANGHPVSARAITRWKAERRGKSLKGSDEILDQFVVRWHPLLAEQYPPQQSDGTQLTVNEAKAAAAAFIKILNIAGF